MSATDEFLRETDNGKLPESKPWRGFILDAPAGLADPVYIVVPGISGDLKRGPCLWMPRGALLPAAGNACVAQMDTDKQWWVLAWSPYAE